MLSLKAMGTSDVIAVLAMAASAFSAFYAWYAVRAARQQFEAGQARERDVHVAANYLALETASSDIFRYTAENESCVAPIRGEVAEEQWSGARHADARATLLNLYYQSLNLFEVCARYRRQNMVRAEVFASWVSWFAEILEDSYFRAQWHPVVRANYTKDVRDIFDVGVGIFNAIPEPERRQAAFFSAVAEIMDDCETIAGWLSGIREERVWSQLKASRAFISPGTNPSA